MFNLTASSHARGISKSQKQKKLIIEGVVVSPLPL